MHMDLPSEVRGNSVNTIKLLKLKASNFRSLRDETVTFGNFNVFIGPNASGKSTVLDALRFLQDGLRARDFQQAVSRRGGARYLVGKWEETAKADLSLHFEDVDEQVRYEWSIGIVSEHRRFLVNEDVSIIAPNGQLNTLLSVRAGSGWWLSEDEKRINIEQGPTTSAFATASADASFAAREVYRFIAGWSFVDPDLYAVRHGWPSEESDRLDIDGRNLAERLNQLTESSPEVFERIVSAMKSVLGVPEKLESVLHHQDQFHIHFDERGLISPVIQMSASSGTLRTLTLMTALFEKPECGVVAIEEPENNIHPTALGDFVQYLVDASQGVQVLITTHSPTLLNFIEDPNSVCVVQRDAEFGTKVVRERNPKGVIQALEASGFSLGEFHETMGFGR